MVVNINGKRLIEGNTNVHRKHHRNHDHEIKATKKYDQRDNIYHQRVGIDENRDKFYSGIMEIENVDTDVGSSDDTGEIMQTKHKE